MSSSCIRHSAVKQALPSTALVTSHIRDLNCLLQANSLSKRSETQGSTSGWESLPVFHGPILFMGKFAFNFMATDSSPINVRTPDRFPRPTGIPAFGRRGRNRHGKGKSLSCLFVTYPVELNRRPLMRPLASLSNKLR